MLFNISLFVVLWMGNYFTCHQRLAATWRWQIRSTSLSTYNSFW